MRGWVLFFASITLALCPAARAVVVEGGTGSQNTSAPGNGAPWDHVGDNGVYLGDFGGNFWVATATHVAPGNFTLGATTYAIASGSMVQISGSDLTLFRITTSPGLANLTLSTTTPSAGSPVTMIGDGLNRATSSTMWWVDTTPDPWVWNTAFFAEADSPATGYLSSGGSAMRWGSNMVEGFSSYDVGTGVTTSFYTDFDGSGDAQGAVGDSGGAVFFKNEGIWELAGIMGAVGRFSGQPANTSVFGNLTHAVDLAAYNGMIMATTAIPEPAAVGLWSGLLAAGGILLHRRRRVRGRRMADSRRIAIGPER